MPLPPTGFKLFPSMRSYVEGYLFHLDGYHLVAETRTVEGVDIVVFRPAQEGESSLFPEEITFRGQPVYLEPHHEDLRPPSYTGWLAGDIPINRWGEADSLTSRSHKDCPACGGRGVQWIAGVDGIDPKTHVGGCYMCGQTILNENEWFIIATETSTDFEWVYQAYNTEDMAQRCKPDDYEDGSIVYWVCSKEER